MEAKTVILKVIFVPAMATQFASVLPPATSLKRPHERAGITLKTGA